MHTLAGHWGSVASVTFSPDGKWILSGSSDELVKIWDVVTGAQVRSTVEGASRDRYFIAEESAPALLLVRSEGCASLRIVLDTVPRVSRFCEHFSEWGCFEVAR